MIACQVEPQHRPFCIILLLSYHYHTVPSSPALFFFFDWKPLPSTSLSSLPSPPSSALPSVTCIYPSVTAHSSPPSHFLSACPFPKAEALSHPTHSSPSHTPTTLSPTTRSRLLLPAAPFDETSVCVCAVHGSRQTPVPPLLLLFSLSL